MFYRYHQNNSGGRYASHLGYDCTALTLYVEAEVDPIADSIAVRHGVYFDGADENGPDCECCGDRWTRASDRGLDEAAVRAEIKKDGEKPCGVGELYWIIFADGRVEKGEFIDV